MLFLKKGGRFLSFIIFNDLINEIIRADVKCLRVTPFFPKREKRGKRRLIHVKGLLKGSESLKSFLFSTKINLLPQINIQYFFQIGAK